MIPEKSRLDSELLASGTSSGAPEGSVPAIPDHQMLRRIGRGSYGDVWLARTLTGSFRAVKIIYRDWFETAKPFERELAGIRKFEPISRSHPALIQVLQVGENQQEGFFYYVMELGDDAGGAPITGIEAYSPKTLAGEVAVRGGRLPLEECLQLGLVLSGALEYLHDQGLIHRDIKPPNIIFIKGNPKLADIGLVTEITDAQSYVGTEGFIPPEGPGTPQADIYSLGKVLYEISTGKDRTAFPELPTIFESFSDPSGFLELNEVIMKACQAEVRKRYQSAREMRSELEVLKTGRSLRRLRLLERQLAAVRRWAMAALLILALLSAAIFYLMREFRRAAEERQRQAGAYVAHGVRDMEDGNLLGALPWLAEALILDSGDAGRQKIHRARFHAVLTNSPRLNQMWFEEGPLSWSEFSPDRRYVVTATYSGQAQVWDLETGERTGTRIELEGVIRTASFSPDNQFLLIASTSQGARIWEYNSGREIQRFEHPDEVRSALYHPSGELVITSCVDGKARIWNVETGALERELAGHTRALTFACFSPDGHWALTASQDNTARVWNWTTGKMRYRPFDHGAWVFHASFCPEGKRIVTAGFDRAAQIWDLQTGERVPPKLRHNGGVRSAHFSPDGRYILTASYDSTVRLWEAADGQPVLPLLPHSGRVMHAAFCPSGYRVVTASYDRTARVWNLATPKTPPIEKLKAISEQGGWWLNLQGGSARVESFSHHSPHLVPEDDLQTLDGRFSLDGQWLLLLQTPRGGGGARQLRLWNTSRQQFASHSIPAGNLLSLHYDTKITDSHHHQKVVLSADGSLLALVEDNKVHLHGFLRRNPPTPTLIQEAPVKGVSFNMDATQLAAWTEDRAYVWDLATGKWAFEPLRLRSTVRHAAFSKDKRFLVTCSADPSLDKHAAKLWRTSTGAPVGRPLPHEDGVLFASFSSDGTKVVTTGEDDKAAIWDTLTGRLLGPFLMHADQVTEARFSPDDRWILTVSLDNTARVWDAATGDPVTTALRHPTDLWHGVFATPDSILVYHCGQGVGWHWELEQDKRSGEDLALFAQLLSGRAHHRSGQVLFQSDEELQRAWKYLHLNYPHDFEVPLSHVTGWHLDQATHAESTSSWHAAVFHLRLLKDLLPGDTAIKRRLDFAEQQLVMAQSGHTY
jgi:WD40 repeat protein